MHPFRYARQDCLCALMVTLLTLLLVLTSLTVGVHSWGDDFAAYINEGIAIADGDFKEQTERNYVMHTSELPEEANPDGLVYVWGYPLLLSVVYKVVGFDRTNYSSVIWFKLPAAICLSLLGGVMVLFFRRRFSLTASAMMSLLICLSGDLYDSVNNLQADVVFMFFSMLTLLLVEVFVTAIADHRSCVGIGLLYGVIAWFMREVRLNGSTVIIIALVGHVIAVLKKQVGFEKKNVYLHLLPYGVCILLSLITERLFLAPATSNLSDVGGASREIILENARYYGSLLTVYLNGLSGIQQGVTGPGLLCLAVLGIIGDGFKDNFHLTLLLFGSLVVLIILPYTDGLRYLFNVLPILMMFIGYGFRRIWCWTKKMTHFSPRVVSIAGNVAVIVILILPIINRFQQSGFNLDHMGWMMNGDVYCSPSKDMYQYIQENIPEDSIIAFWRPRALYLNTGRMAIRPGRNGHTIADADYYLKYGISHNEIEEEKQQREETPMVVQYENEFFQLYNVKNLGEINEGALIDRATD